MKNVFINELNKFKKIIDNKFEEKVFYDVVNADKFHTFMDKYLCAFQNYSRGGKRIRAYLVELGYEMCTRNYDERILLPSLSYEIFQTGVLIHDDIIDESTTRRNMPTMHVSLGNNHPAISKAICIGDIGLFSAIDAIIKSGFSDASIIKAIEHQIRVFEVTISGELKDIELSTLDEYKLDDVIEMYELKTSWYTFIGPLQLGAILGGASSEVLSQIKEIGLAMGVAFQIKDDILGIFGNESTIGKSNLSDMQEGKKTVLTNHFMTNASAEQISQFKKIYGNRKSSVNELYIVQRLFKETNTFEYSNALCQQYAEKSKSIIRSMYIDDKYKNILLDCLLYLCDRQL